MGVARYALRPELDEEMRQLNGDRRLSGEYNPPFALCRLTVDPVGAHNPVVTSSRS